MISRAMCIARCSSMYLLLSGSISTGFGQTIYYVANSGSDANTGQTSDAPYQTIAKVNTLTLQPGDQVLFKRNDTFRGTLQIRQSGTSGRPIVIDAYGSGNKPVLAGSVPVTNWVNLGNNVWKANCPSCGDRITGLYRNNSALPLGRYPNLDAGNRGYLTVQAHAGRSQLVGQQSFVTNWTGGEAVFRANQWIMNRSTINGQSGNTLYLNNSGTYDITDGWGYFIQNHPATLDQTGEWYYNPTDNKSILLFDSQNNPNSQSITATAYNEAVNLVNVSQVTVRNLQLSQSLLINLLVDNGTDLTFSGNDIIQAGEDGVVVKGNGNRVLLENNLIENINNNGVDIWAYQAITFRGNTVRNVGLSPGRGRSGDGTYVGFMSASTGNTMIEDNVIDNIGYNALNFASSTTIQRNRISNFCLTKSDGSAIYIWNGNQRSMGDIHIVSNFVYNGIGAPEGTSGGAYSGANGIYLDDCTSNIEVANNTSYNCRGLGIFLHGSSSISVTGNTSFNNGEGQLAITDSPGCQPRSNVIQNNVFVSKLASQFNVKYESTQNDLASYGQMNNNVYARPFDDTYVIRAVYNRTVGADLLLADWRSRYGKDLNTTQSPFIYSSGTNPDDVLRLVANPTGSSIQVSLSGTYRDARNNPFTDQITVAAYSSVVLFKDLASAPVSLRDPENPANAVAGLDYSYYEYEAAWIALPDFSTLTPVKRGTNSQINLTPRNREDNFAFQYRGYVNVPTDGLYTFYLTSDDGSKLFIGSTELINSDGSHPEQERSGAIGLKAGRHAITVPYYEGGGNQALGLSYSGPGIGKQVIPASAYFRVPTDTPPPPPVALRDPENPANSVAGLDYSYYEGTWGNLPDFNALMPVKTGTSGVPDLTPRNREDNFGLRFTGYVNVPADGVYTFFTNSDDGSKLFIGTTEVVNNDGGHPEQERSGTIGLKAGRHAITVPYYEGGGDQALSVSYSGPGLSKQIIPALALFRVSTGTPPVTVALRDPENPANAVAGIDYSYYEGSWGNLPDFNALTPVKTGTSGVPDLTPRNREDNFALQFRGYVNVPADGVYTFFTNSDDGSKLFIGTTEVVNNDGGHPEQERSGTIGLKAGRHAITVPYYEGGGDQALSVSYSGPGLSKQIIPASALFRVSTGTPPVTVALRDPENPANAVVGLDYSYYEGSWGSLPNFGALTPVKTGAGSLPELTVRNRDNDYALRYTGYVNVPADGVYTFFTNSDDGSKLFIGSTEVVNNDGAHGEQERSGTIGLKAGRHAITIPYYQGGSGQALSVSYSGPGLSRQTIPASAFFRVNTMVGGSGTGLNADYFNNQNLLAPIMLTRTDASVNFDWGMGSPASGINTDYFSVRWTGQVKAPVTGNYTFSTTTDDGVRLWVNGQLLINDWNGHAPTTNSGPAVALVAGQRYDIRMEYFDNTAGAVAKLLWAYPGQGQQPVPQAYLYPSAGAGRMASASTTDDFNSEAAVQVYPVPAREEVQVRYYAETAGELQLQLTSIGAYPVMQKSTTVVQGGNVIRIPVREYTRGLYILSLIQGTQRITRKVLLAD